MIGRGLFVRGDRAIDMHRCIRQLQQLLAVSQDATVVLALHVLGELADIIERDVVYPTGTLTLLEAPSFAWRTRWQLSL